MIRRHNLATSIILLITTQLLRTSVAFYAPTTTNIRTIIPQIAIQNRLHKTALRSTIRFRGTARSKLTSPYPPRGPDRSDRRNDITVSAYLSEPELSDAVLLGMKPGGGVATARKIEQNEDSSTWECRQADIEWFGMTLIPIFVNGIERSRSFGGGTQPGSASRDNGGAVTISIVDAKTLVENGGRFGNALGSAMKRSVFQGRNVVFWKEEDGSYTLEGNIELSLTIELPPFLPRPPGFNGIGSKIVERTCRERLRQNLRDVSDAYTRWANSQFID